MLWILETSKVGGGDTFEIKTRQKQKERNRSERNRRRARSDPQKWERRTKAKIERERERERERTILAVGQTVLQIEVAVAELASAVSAHEAFRMELLAHGVYAVLHSHTNVQNENTDTSAQQGKSIWGRASLAAGHQTGSSQFRSIRIWERRPTSPSSHTSSSGKNLGKSRGGAFYEQLTSQNSLTFLNKKKPLIGFTLTNQELSFFSTTRVIINLRNCYGNEFKFR